MDDTMVYNWLKKLQTLFYPAHCSLCGAPGEHGLELCGGCRGDLAVNQHACRLCGLPIKAAGETICGRCLREPPPIDAAHIPFLYQPPLDHLLRELKFRQKLARGPVIAALLHDALIRQHRKAWPQALLPIPLHPRRLAERGFNQAEELAGPLSRRLAIPLDNRLCKRIKATEAQTDLDAKRRQKNLREAFALTDKPAYEHVAIIDDVVTTGSTSFELARSLKRAGVKRVELWAAARAQPPR